MTFVMPCLFGRTARPAGLGISDDAQGAFPRALLEYGRYAQKSTESEHRPYARTFGTSEHRPYAKAIMTSEPRPCIAAGRASAHRPRIGGGQDF